MEINSNGFLHFNLKKVKKTKVYVNELKLFPFGTDITILVVDME
ncbi:hypothetical protein SAMN05661091_2637 [Paenibacillus uliginis N3/975]|uniref:Uncharacterized protein n=1 Tax=Paenibacillus uliginis N3/975 TaxID=1313296 RepID=A0A1X7HEE9_9BACL|nr:hypothetical protein SAMN05661091_2637 [Paenibacillus uliginis N3/975]